METKDLKEHLDTAVSDVKDRIKQQNAEIEKHGETTAETAKALESATKRMDEVKSEIDRIIDERKKDDERIVDLEKRLNRGGMSEDEQAKTLGHMLVESKQYKAAVEANDTKVSPVTASMSLKDLTSAPASGGSLNQPMRRDEIFRDPADRMAFIRDLLPMVPTADGSVEIIVEKSFVNNAGPQAATGTGSGLGAGELEKKAKSNLMYELDDVKIRTLAHWIPASRQILADAPRLRAEINSRLIYGLMIESDSQLLFGDGSGQNLEGIMVNSDVSDIGALEAGLSAVERQRAMIRHIRRAITKCQVNEYRNVNGLVMNPEDWEDIETATGTDGHYIWASVQTGAGERIWRVPVIPTNAQNEGEFVLGDWQMGATLYDREQVSVRVSESHEEFFIKNAVAILAEERIGLGVHRPLAFTKGQFTSATG